MNEKRELSSKFNKHKGSLSAKHRSMDALIDDTLVHGAGGNGNKRQKQANIQIVRVSVTPTLPVVLVVVLELENPQHPFLSSPLLVLITAEATLLGLMTKATIQQMYQVTSTNLLCHWYSLT
jgi:hypothetical protein